MTNRLWPILMGHGEPPQEKQKKTSKSSACIASVFVCVFMSPFDVVATRVYNQPVVVSYTIVYMIKLE